jgi:hypothetical protein
MRIELTQPAWKAGVLPLNYTRVKGVFTFLTLIFKRFFMVEGEGFEPSKTEVNGFTARPI